MSGKEKTPLWVVLVILLCMLPVLAFPTILSSTDVDTPARTFAWFYPLYVVASGVCAYVCYAERQVLTWILLILMLMTHAAMWALVMM